jgi:hypothetical protein
MDSRAPSPRLLVRDVLPEGTTFAVFVRNTRGFRAEGRVDALHMWLQQQPVGKLLATFEGTEEELEVLLKHVKGKRKFTSSDARLTVYSA